MTRGFARARFAVLLAALAAANCQSPTNPSDKVSYDEAIDMTSAPDPKPERDAYIVQCGGDAACDFPQTITVPRGEYYMMGDNRPDSEDSRFWGPVPRAWIIGKAFLTYWPPDRIGFL